MSAESENTSLFSHVLRSKAVTLAAKIFCVVAVGSALGAFTYHARALFLKYPPVWPDEPLFFNPALNLLHRGVIVTDILPERTDWQPPGWQPPGYFIFLSVIFRVVHPSIVSLRLSSVGAALLVLILTYFLGRRSGLGAWLALIPVSLVAIDTVFLRGALIGRPDMLELSLILAALSPAMRSRSGESPGRPHWFLAGVISGAAVVTHPMGVVAPTALVATRIPPLVRRRERIGRALAPLLGGGMLVAIPWALYVLKDVNTSWAQFGSQFQRNAKYSGSRAVRVKLASYLPQYQSIEVRTEPPTTGNPSGSYEAVPGTPWGLLLGPCFWVTGLLGLGLAAKRHWGLLALPICQVLIGCLVWWGNEHWYALYLVPLSALGLVHLTTLARERSVWRVALASLAAFVCVWYTRANASHTATVNYAVNQLGASTTDYFEWCGKIGNALPAGSKVLLSVIPDPYFGLAQRPDLTLREFLPVILPLDKSRYRRYLVGADYVIVGPPDPGRGHIVISGGQSPDPRVDQFVETEGQLVGVVGSAPGYVARIYKVAK